MRGQAVYMYVYDVAEEIDLPKAREALAAQFLKVSPDKTIPRDFPFYQPLHLDRGEAKLSSSIGELSVRREVKIFSVGAISILLRVSFDVERMMDLIRYHALELESKTDLDDAAGRLCDEVVTDLKDSASSIHHKGDPEAYTVFCLVEKVPGIDGKTALQWLDDWRAEVAGLLTEEQTFDRLSDSEIQETTKYAYSYLAEDLVVVDWDSALILDPSGKYEDMLYALELANVQLTEFQVYDQMLEKYLEQAYVDIEKYSYGRGIIGGPGAVLDRLKAVFVDLTKTSEGITNITKFFGDWHQARVYMGCSERFHLKEWEHSVEEKLRTLDNLYGMISDDLYSRRMLVLEVSIVLLFVIDVLMLFMKR